MNERQELQNKIIEKAMTDDVFKKALQENPKQALKDEFDIDLPEDVKIEVLEETSNKYYITLPACPEENKTSNYMW